MKKILYAIAIGALISMLLLSGCVSRGMAVYVMPFQDCNVLYTQQIDNNIEFNKAVFNDYTDYSAKGKITEIRDDGLTPQTSYGTYRACHIYFKMPIYK